MRIVCAQTCNTIQDSRGASACLPVDGRVLARQVEVLLDDFNIAAIKLGLLGSIETIQIVAEVLRNVRCPTVLDPILNDGSGRPLAIEPTAQALREQLVPLASLLTPNRHELFVLEPADTVDRSAQNLLTAGCHAVLVTGSLESQECLVHTCLLYTSPSPRDRQKSRMPSSA